MNIQTFYFFLPTNFCQNLNVFQYDFQYLTNKSSN